MDRSEEDWREAELRTEHLRPKAEFYTTSAWKAASYTAIGFGIVWLLRETGLEEFVSAAVALVLVYLMSRFDSKTAWDRHTHARADEYRRLRETRDKQSRKL